MTTTSDEEFESEAANNWDDIDIVEDDDFLLINRSSGTHYLEECWKCIECQMINNLSLTIRKYNYKCCGCNNQYYIKNQTETTYECSWNEPNDYLLKLNAIWMCQLCTFSNSNMNANRCQICKAQRNEKQKQIVDNDNNISPIHWQCLKCNNIIRQSSNKCTFCDCNRPKKYKYGCKSNKYLIAAFCKYYFDGNIPQVIKYLIIKHSKEPQTFNINQYIKRNSNTKVTYIPYETYHFNEGDKFEIFGNEFTKCGPKRLWKLKLSMETDDVSYEKAKICKISIGFIYQDEKHETHYHVVKGNGDILPIFRDGDIIIVELDTSKNTISCGINENWYDVILDNLPDEEFEFYAKIQQQGVSVCLMS